MPILPCDFLADRKLGTPIFCPFNWPYEFDAWLIFMVFETFLCNVICPRVPRFHVSYKDFIIPLDGRVANSDEKGIIFISHLLLQSKKLELIWG